MPDFAAVGGVLLGATVLLVVAGTGVVVAAALRITNVGQLVLAAYVVGFADVVALSLFLSLFGEMTRAMLVAGSLTVFAAATGIWLLVGAPRPPRLPPRALGSLERSRPVLVLAVAVGGALMYVAVLILRTPPNGWDQLNYQLARAAFWAQDGRIGYVDSAYDQRINIYPPDGEAAFAFVLSVTRNEVFAALVQFAAALACAVGAFVFSRRLRIRREEAAFGSLLFLTLPIVLLQASTTKNDLVVASFLVAAAVFLLGDSRREIGLAALATALAVGTKSTAFYGVVVLVALAVVALPRSRLPMRLAALVGGTLIGRYWYAVNMHDSGRFLGDTSGIPGLTAILSPRANLVEAVGLGVDTVDLSGSSGADLFVYLLVALAVVGGLAFFGSRRERGRYRWALVAGVLVASPLALYVVTTRIGRPAFVRLYDALGHPTAYIPPNSDPNSSPTFASDTGSWYGPVGLLLAIGVGVAVVVLVRRGSLPRTAAVAAVAPAAWLVLLALSLTYHPWQGRFFLFPVALSASLWGLALRVRSVAWAATALGATTAALSLVHYAEKPSGLRLLDRSTVASVWTMPRWQVQSLHDPSVGPVFRFLDDDVPQNASIALAYGVNDFGYPVFGPHLDHHVELVPFGSNARDIRADWLLADPKRMSEIDTACWEPVFRSDNGTVFQRQSECAG